MKTEIKEYIQELNSNKQYPECIRACEMSFDDVEEADIWFIYMEMSKSYRHLKQYKDSMKNLQNAIRYNNTEVEYIQTLWQMGILLKFKGEKKKALRFYKKCADYYLSNNMTHQYIDMLHCEACLVNNLKLAYEVLEMYKSINVENHVIENALESIKEIKGVLTNQLQLVVNK